MAIESIYDKAVINSKIRRKYVENYCIPLSLTKGANVSHFNSPRPIQKKYGELLGMNTFYLEIVKAVSFPFCFFRCYGLNLQVILGV